MALIFRTFSDKAEFLLKYGGVGVIPTDTIYGIVGSALKKETVERIYKLRARNLKKPMIVLIGSVSELKKFGVRIDANAKKTISEFWAGKKPVSIILPLNTKNSSLYTRLVYLHRGKGSVAFRLPACPPSLRSSVSRRAKRSLCEFLKKTGPLVAPSANLEGMLPAKTIREAKNYFDDRVDFYVDGGRIEGKSSRLISIKNGKVITLRP